MKAFQQIREMTVGIVSSYDEGICAVGEILGKSLAMLEQYCHTERFVQNQIRETLARVESLRKKDFDLLMAPIFVYQGRREQEIKQFLNLFLKRQRELAGQLKRMIQTGILLKVPDLEKAIQKTIEEAKDYLVGFQKEQTLIGEKMQSLLCKKEKLTLKEFKKTLEILEGELGLDGKGKTALSGNSVTLHC